METLHISVQHNVDFFRDWIEDTSKEAQFSLSQLWILHFYKSIFL